MPLTNKLEFYYFFNQIKRIWKIGNDIFKCIFHSFDFYEFPENWKKKWVRTVVVAVEKRKNNFYGKAANRIPLWAKHPEQYCHKIIRAFFQCQEEKEQFMQ